MNRKTTRAPVFIVGSPRSGTSLLRVTLNRHPRLAMCGETDFFRRLYNRRHAFGDPADPRNRERIVDAYLAIHMVGGLGLDIEVLRERMKREGVSWRALFASMLQLCADSQGKPYTGEKTPAHALHVDALCEWFPDCSVIHLVRDPRAATCSLTHMPWASRSVLMGARTWRIFNAAALRVSSRDNYLRIQYENLVARPEEQLRRICSHIGLDYSETMLEPKIAEINPRRPDPLSFEEITSARVSLWQRELEPWQVSAIETVAGRHMEEFGYERQTKRTRPVHLSRAALEAVVDMTFQKFLRLPSMSYHLLQPTNVAAEQRWLARASATYGRLRSRRPVGGPQASVAGGRD
jgi:Sulfotransferase family